MSRFSLFQFVKKQCKLYDVQQLPVVGPLHLLVIISSLMYFIRILICVYFLAIRHSTSYLEYDQLLGQLYSLGIVDYYIFLAFSPMVLFFLYLHMTLHFPAKSERNVVITCWRFINALLMASFTYFCDQNSIYQNWRLAKKTKKVKKFFMFRLLRQIGFNCKGEMKSSRRKMTMVIIPNNANLKEEKEQKRQLVSTWLGLEAAVVYFIFNSKYFNCIHFIDFKSLIFLLFTVAFTTLTIVYFRFLPLFLIYSIPYAMLATFDYLIFGTGALLGIYNTLIFASSIIVVSLVSRRSFAAQRQLLKSKIAIEKRNESSSFSLVNLASSVATFRASHTQLARFLATFNKTISAKFFASFLMGNISYNAYSFMFIAFNRDHSVGPLFRLAFSCWQVAHAMAPVSVATYVVKINRQMYEAQKLISGLLAATTFQKNKTSSLLSKVTLSIPLLREQWKLATYFELFDRGESAKKTKTMAMTAAIFGLALEWQTMFEFALIYGAFLMHFGGWIVQGKRAEAEAGAFGLKI